jgi:protein-S-isoprenylcysteine O-methyltransferase Ste14
MVAGVIPWWLTRWEIQGSPAIAWPARLAGVALIAGGLPVLVSAFVRFASEGRGTPAPIAPTEHLVVGGLYRHVRNPMYLAVLAIIFGQSLVFWQVELLVYGAAVGAAMVTFVHVYEEPVLRHRYGASYDAYRRAVPGWWPRLHAWSGRPGD